jgi:hypothetical protein
VFNGSIDLNQSGTYDIHIPLDNSFIYSGRNLVVMTHSSSANLISGFAGAAWQITAASNRVPGITSTDPINPANITGFIIQRLGIPNTAFIFNDSAGSGDPLNVVLSSFNARVNSEGEEVHELPIITTMSNMYPNPMKSGSLASFGVSVKEDETANLHIFNIRGQLVHEVKNIRPGNHRINWNGRDRNNREVASGIYFYSLTSPSMHNVRRMVIMK